MLTSGTIIKTLSPIRCANGALIEAGTEAMVLAVPGPTGQQAYLAETLENPLTEVEEFFCFERAVEVVR